MLTTYAFIYILYSKGASTLLQYFFKTICPCDTESNILSAISFLVHVEIRLILQYVVRECTLQKQAFYFTPGCIEMGDKTLSTQNTKTGFKVRIFIF